MAELDRFSLTRYSINEELANFGCQNAVLRFYELTDSTNTRAKEELSSSVKRPEAPYIYIANGQSAGRGRLGRRFSSGADTGLYMSVLFPLSSCTSDTATLTAMAAVATAEAIETLSGERMGIKWVNDIYHGGRKLAGILSEGVYSAELGRLEYAIIGIGINVTKTAFSGELAEIATDIETETGKRLSRARLAALIFKRLSEWLHRLESPELISEYRSRSTLIGKCVTVSGSGEPYPAEVLDINRRAELIVKLPSGEIRALNSGEVSARLK